MLDLLSAATKTKERVSKPRYLYVTDQGEVFGSVDAPTRGDLQFSAVGMLTIVRLADLHYRHARPKWRPVEAGALTNARMSGEHPGAFHAIEP